MKRMSWNWKLIVLEVGKEKCYTVDELDEMDLSITYLAWKNFEPLEVMVRDPTPNNNYKGKVIKSNLNKKTQEATKLVQLTNLESDASKVMNGKIST